MPGPAPTAPSPRRDHSRRAGVAAFIGTTIEWYDFFIYGTASALIFGPLFFPELDPVAGILASFATFGVGYVARPIGAIIFGHIGDRVGRKASLVITLVMMGTATVLIGVLPTYANAGILAPALLVTMRLIQGLAVGGEWGGAVLIASEHAGRTRRVAAGAWAQQGAPAGNLLATLAFLLAGSLPAEQFDAWGWRIPFLASAILIVVGLFIRLRVAESPEFVEMKQAAREAAAPPRAPIAEVVRRMPLLILLGALAGAAANSAQTFASVFGLSWGTTAVGIDRQSMLTAILVMTIVQFFVQPVAAVFAGRFEPARFMIITSLVAIPILPVAYLLVGTGNILLVSVGLVAQIIPFCLVYALIAGFLADAFPARVRYTAISLSYQITAIAFTAFVPTVSQALLSWSGTIIAVVGYQIACVVLSLVGIIFLARLTGAGTRRPVPERSRTSAAEVDG